MNNSNWMDNFKIPKKTTNAQATVHADRRGRDLTPQTIEKRKKDMDDRITRNIGKK